MGNAETVHFREDTKRLEITEKLVRDFQYHINLVDHSMTGFARSIDSLRASCATLQQRQNDSKDSNKEDASVGGDGDVAGSPQDSLLLDTIDGLVSDHKFVVIQSLSKLFSLIIETGCSCSISTPKTMLAVDKYMQQNVTENLGKKKQYLDARLESMQREVKRVNDAYQIAKNDIENLNRREEIYLEEKMTLKNRIEELEKRLSNTQCEIKGLINDINNEELVMEGVRREMSSLQKNEEQMRNEIKEKTSCLRRLKESHKVEMDALQMKIEKLEQEHKTNVEKLDEMQRNIDLLYEEKCNRTADLEGERQTILSLRENIKCLTEENEKAKKLKQLQKAEIWRLTETSKQDSIKILKGLEVFEEQQRLYEKDIRSSNEKNICLEVEIRNLKLEFKEKQTQIETLEENHTLEVAKCRTKYEEFQENNKETNAKLSRGLEVFEEQQRLYKEDIKASNENKVLLEDEIRRLKVKVKEKQKQIETLEKNHELEIAKWRAENEKLQEDIKDTMSKMLHLQREVESLQNTNVSLQTDIVREREMIESKTQEKLSTQLNSLKEGLKEMIEGSIDAKQETVAKLSRGLEVFEEQQRLYKKEITSTYEKLICLEGEIRNLKAELEEKQKQIETLEENHGLEIAKCSTKSEELLEDNKETNSKLLKGLEMVWEQQRIYQENIKAANENKILLEDEIRRLKVEVKQKQKQIQTLEENHELEIAKSRTENEKLQEDNKETMSKIHLQKEVESLQNKNDSLQSDIVREREMSEYKSQEKLSNPFDSLKDEIKKMTAESSDVKRVYAKCLEQEKTIRELEKQLEKEKKIHTTDSHHINREIELLAEENISTHPNLKRDRDLADHLTTEMIQEDIEQMKIDYAELKHVHEKQKQIHEESLAEERSSKDKCMEQVNALQEEQQQKNERISRLNKEKESLTTKAKDMEAEIKSLQRYLEIAALKKVMYVQVCHLTGFHALAEEGQLQSLLRTKIEAMSIDLEFLNCSRFVPISTNMPTLIACSRDFRNTRSRFISTCLNSFEESPKTALLIFHQRRERDFRKEAEVTSDKAGKCYGVFDIGFYENGIYKSETNSRNIEKILQFFLNEGVPDSRTKESAVSEV